MLAVLLLAAVPPAVALTQRGHQFALSFGSTGEGTLSKPGAIAVNAQTGDVYVLDRRDNRVVQYGPQGQFISTWGWDVNKSGKEGAKATYEVCTSECKAGKSGRGDYEFNNYTLAIAVDNCTTGEDKPCSEDPSVGDVYIVKEYADKKEVGELKKDEAEKAKEVKGKEKGGEVFTEDEEEALEHEYSNYMAIDKFTPSGEPVEEFAYNEKACEQEEEHPAKEANKANGGRLACEDEFETEHAHGLTVSTGGTPLLYYEEELVPFDDAHLSVTPQQKPLSLSLSGEEPKEGVDAGVTQDARGHFYIGQRVPGPTGSSLELTSEWEALENEAGETELEEVKFALDDEETTGVVANTLDVPGNQVDELNDVYISNVVGEPGKRSSTVAQFAPDGSLVQRFTAPGLREGDGVAVNPATGSVYVTDAASGAVDLFTLQEPGAPTVDDASVQEVSSESAQLNGEIDPDGAASTYAFRYSTGTVPGATEPCVTPCVETPTGEGPLGDDYADHTVKAELKLQAANTYHYRLIARNSHGAGEGPEHAFSTPPATGKYVADERDWEMVSPARTGGYYVLPLGYELGGLTQAAATGDAITYIASGPFAQPEDSRAPESAQILSVRGSEGWHSKDIATPNSAPVGVTVNTGQWQEYDFFTPDLTLALLRPFEGESPLAKPPLAPPVSEAETQLMQEEQRDGAPLAYQNNTIYVRDDKPVGAQGEEPLSTQSPFAPAGEAETALFNEAQQNGSLMDNPGYLALINGANAPGVPFGSQETLAPVGATPDLAHVVIWSELGLTSGGARKEAGLYEWSRAQPGVGATLAQVNLLPETEAPSAEAQLGSGGSNMNPDKGWSLLHAISNDGTRIFWNDSEGLFGNGHLGEGHLYMRATATPPEDPARQETVQLDKARPPASEPAKGAAVFQTASADGSRVFFTDKVPLTEGSGGGDLYVCEIQEDHTTHRLECELTDLTPRRHTAAGYENAGVQGMLLGASEDGSYVYYVANGVLTQAPNAAGEQAAPGLCGVEDGPPETCNLYMRHYDAGMHEWEAPQFIATLSGNGGPSGRGDGTDWDELNASSERIETGRASLTARVSPNGQHLAFMSERALTGYDNHDALSGAPDQEVYEYTAPAEGAPSEPGQLICASCDPSGARPAGVLVPPAGPELLPGETERSSLLIDAGRDLANEWLAASLPESPGLDLHSEVGMYENRALTSSGRLFFNSPSDLVPEAKNAEQDVYEYEPLGVPRGRHQCTSHSATFDAGAGGCLGLISSGASSSESAFLDASESGGEGAHGEELDEGGGDVFFLTAAKLVPQDTEGAFAAFDAHECTSASPCIVPPEQKPPVVCRTSEACRPYTPSSSPSPGAPASASSGPSGNVVPVPKHGVLGHKAVKPKPGTGLTRALKRCRAKYKRHKRKRLACEKGARKAYAARTPAKQQSKKKAGAR